MGKYSETLTDHVMAPRNGGAIENPDLIGHAGAPGRGAFMILYLKVQDERITAAKYHTVGCGPTIASGSMLTEMIVGRSIAQSRELTVENLIEALDGVPPDKLHCPALAIGALQDALSKWSGPLEIPKGSEEREESAERRQQFIEDQSYRQFDPPTDAAESSGEWRRTQ
jgi:nitrogen fixation protein NifU and related proteins